MTPLLLGGGWAWNAPFGRRPHKQQENRKNTLLQKALSVLRSFVNNERQERRAALREQRERKPSEESREIAARRVFFGLRRAELARPAALVARPAALFGLRRQTNQAKEPGLRRLSTHLLAHAAWIGFASKWQQANPPVVVQQHASLIFRSLLIPAGCNSYGPVILCLK